MLSTECLHFSSCSPSSSQKLKFYDLTHGTQQERYVSTLSTSIYGRLAITLVSKCRVLENWKKLHQDMVCNTINRAF